MNTYKLISASTDVPVDLTGFKNHINFSVADTSKDDNLNLLLNAAIDEAKQFTGREFMPAIYEMHLGEFPLSVEIEIEPVTVVNSVTYFDSSNTEQTLVSGTDYYVEIDAKPPRIIFVNAYSVHPYRPDPVHINFGAGYSTADNVPASIKAAILFAAADYYVNPIDSVRNMPTKSKALLRNYRLYNP